MTRAKHRTTTGGLLAAAALLAQPAFAENPIIRHIYTADPAPMVYGDTVYLCTSHDEDVTVDNFFTMNDWFVFSSKDMVNWTDHGSPLSYQTFSWSNGKAWAPHCVERGGKFYFYVPVSPNSIGVAVADSPTGPFTDPIGAPLVTGSYQYIDPTVFVDSDGQAYLYFGNPKLWYVKLNENMISYSGSITEIPQTTQSFGTRAGNAERPTLYEEGPWFYRRGDLYYMLYAATGIPEDIGYSTSPGPTGPWTYRGIIMPNQSGHAFTNHAGVIDFQGRSFFFYHTQEAPGGGGYKRSVAVEEFTYNSDGSFPTINKTSAGVTESVEPLIPYYRVEGETMAFGSGIEVEDSSDGGRNLSNLENGDYIKLRAVDFLTGPVSFEASVASATSGGTIELRIDGVDGALIGTCPVGSTGGWQSWELVSCEVSEVTDLHDLYLVFTGPGGFLFNIDYWQFTPKDPLPDGTGGADGAGGSLTGTGGEASSGSGGTSTGGEVSSGGFPSQSSGGTMSDIEDPADESAQSEAGCACTLARRSSRDHWAWLFASLALIGFRRRRSVHANVR
jgi:arabinoxylan arabinofuranohydrolase